MIENYPILYTVLVPRFLLFGLGSRLIEPQGWNKAGNDAVVLVAARAMSYLSRFRV